MFTSNIQFGYPCPRGGGQAVQAGLSCPPPRICVKQCHQTVNSYCTIILEYLVVRDINIISVKLRCLQPTFSLVTRPRGGGKAVQTGLSCPPTKDLDQTVSSVNSYYLRLTEIKFISISTKYSCSRWCNKICGLSILSEILGGGGWGGAR